MDRRYSYMKSFDERNPYKKKEHALGCNKMVCAYHLGGAECIASKKRAIKIAAQTAKALGAGWMPKINQNLGWHPRAISPCGRWKVHPHIYGFGKIESYSAFLGEAGSGGGIWSGSGATPVEAVEIVRRLARTQIEYYASLLDMVTNA